MRKFAAFFMALMLLHVCLVAEAETTATDLHTADGTLRLWFPQVTEADCALIQCGGQNLLVDCGTKNDFEAICEMLEAAQVEKLDAIFISHPHHDHMGALELLLDAYPVGTLYVCHDKKESAKASNMWRWAETRNVPVVRCHTGDVLTVGETKLELYLSERSGVDMNERSGVLRLEFGSCSALLTADIGPYTMQLIHEQMGDAWLKADILKFPHHGARALYDAEMQTIAPDYIVISAEKQGRDGKKQAEAQSATVIYTDTDITCFTCNGTAWLQRSIATVTKE